jgi:hypothetical protein
MGLVLGAGLMLPCLVLGIAVHQDHYSIIEANTERKTAAHVMMLLKCKPLNEDDAL